MTVNEVLVIVVGIRSEIEQITKKELLDKKFDVAVKNWLMPGDKTKEVERTRGVVNPNLR